jgi:hypothetical protein
MKTLQNIITIIAVILTVNNATAQSITPGIKIATATAQIKTIMVGTTQANFTQVNINVNALLSANFNTIEIERSFDNVQFTSTVKNVQSFFTVEKNNNIQFTDASKLLTGKKVAFYRVKMIDNYGNTTFSKVTTVGLEG